MKGDFTRNSFRPERHDHGVLKQQGRVVLDADWNEQGAITAQSIETGTADILGPAGAPEGDPGFLITAANGDASLNISQGRAYVGGVLCQNEQDVLITAQPDLPGFSLLTSVASYIVYLDVWQRHITALDDAGILEVALDGPDTCTRARTVWQVKLLQGPSPNSDTPALDCGTSVAAWDTLVAGSTGTLQAQAQPGSNTTGPCCVPATAGFQSLENQLYRVEIHAGGDIAGGKVTYKWSRDNGAVVTTWVAPQTGQDPSILSVASTGPSSALGFAAGQWVELIDDTLELNFQPGTLVQITSVQGLTITVNKNTATGSITYTDFPKNPKIRRWDSAGAVTAATGSWANLENGVQVQFGSGTYTTGDYWLIPARTLTGQIEWPVDSTSKPKALPPLGIQHHYCRLAVVAFDGKTWSVSATCLEVFQTQPPIIKALHVTAVQLERPQQATIALVNDSSIPIATLDPPVTTSPPTPPGLGIRVYLDAPVDPSSARVVNCSLTAEMPYPLFAQLATNQQPRASNASPVSAYQPTALQTQVTVTNTATQGQIDVQVDPVAILLINELLFAGLTSGVLIRLRIMGHYIWALNHPRMYLDGQVFGVTSSALIAARLPRSGANVAASDLEMWFWLTRPVSITNVSFSPSVINAGQSTTLEVDLDGLAPPGGAVIQLNTNPSSSLIPATLTIPAGQSSVHFTVTNATLPAGVPQMTLNTTGSYGASTASGSLSINEVVFIKSLTLSPSSLIFPVGVQTLTTQVTITLTGPAPRPNGALINITYSPGQLTGPAQVTMGGGNVFFFFTVTANAVGGTAQISASYNGATVQASLPITVEILT
jgi:hypothetical protein